MKRIFTILVLTASSCLAIDNPISAENMASWLAYNKPVTLERHDAATNELSFLPGKLVWLTGYMSKERTISVYYLALYKGGTFLAGRRAETEKRIEEWIANSESVSLRRQSIKAIRTRNDGRKVFFDDMFLGQGGGGEIAFTTLPGQQYDLVVAHIAGDDYELPEEQRTNDPPFPQNTLSDIYDMIEGAILNGPSPSVAGKSPQSVPSPEP